MSRTQKWFHAGLICLLTGFALCLTVACLKGFDWAGLGTELHYDAQELEIEEPFDTVDLRGANGEDLRVLPAEDGVCRLVMPQAEDASLRSSAEVRDGVLHIVYRDERPWYQHLNVFVSTGATGVTLYWPEDRDALTVLGTSGNVSAEEGLRLESLTVSTTSGKVNVKAAIDGELRVRSTSGDVKLWGLRCEGTVSLASTSGELWGLDLGCGSFAAESTSGDQHYDTLRAERVTLASTSGELRFERLTAEEAEIRCTSGDVHGTVTQPMDFRGSTRSGDLHLPEPTRGAGSFRVSTTSGDVHVSVAKN